MEEVRFTKPMSWCCPAYKDYYIQDRYSGRDVYGNDTYEYALYRRYHFQVIRRFRTRKQAYKYVSCLTGYTQWDIKMGSNGIVMNTSEYLGVIYKGIMYRIKKRTCEVATRPLDDERLTGWHMKYVDCLNEAKYLLKDRQEDRTK